MSQVWEISVGRASDGSHQIVNRNYQVQQQQPTKVIVFELPKHNQTASSNEGCSLLTGDCSCDVNLQKAHINDFLHHVQALAELYKKPCPVAWQKLYGGPVENNSTTVEFKLFDNVCSVKPGENDVNRVAAVAFGVAPGASQEQVVQREENLPPQQQPLSEGLPTPPSSSIRPKKEPLSQASPASSSSSFPPPPPLPPPVIVTRMPMESYSAKQSLPAVPVRRRRGDVPGTHRKKKSSMSPPFPLIPRKRVLKRAAKEATLIANKLLLESMEDVTSIDGNTNSEWLPSSADEDEDNCRNYKRLRIPMPYRKRRPHSSQRRRRRH